MASSMVEVLRKSTYALRLQNIEPVEHRLTRDQFEQLRTEMRSTCIYETSEKGVKFEGVRIVVDDDRCSRG